MKISAVSHLLLLGVALLLMLSLGLACGDGSDEATGSPTASPTSSPTASPLPGITSGHLFDYLTSLLEIIEDAESGTAGAVQRINENYLKATQDGEVVSAMQAYLSDIETVFTDAVDRLETLNVPDIAIAQHRTFIEGVHGSIDASNSLGFHLPGLETRAELDERLAQFDAEVDAAVEISNGACFVLQEMADTDNLAIDLDC